MNINSTLKLIRSLHNLGVIKLAKINAYRSTNKWPITIYLAVPTAGAVIAESLDNTNYVGAYIWLQDGSEFQV